MRLSTKNRQAVVPIVLLLVGIMLGGMYLTTLANQPLYHIQIWGDSVGADSTTTSTYWCWNQDGTIVDLGWQDVEDVEGPYGEADFNTATIKGTLSIMITDFGHRFDSVALNYAGEGDLPDGSHTLVGNVIDTQTQHETWWGDGSNFYDWDTTSLPDGDYVITIEGDYGLGPVILTTFSMTSSSGDAIFAPIGMGISTNTSLLLLTGVTLILAVLVYKKKL